MTVMRARLQIAALVGMAACSATTDEGNSFGSSPGLGDGTAGTAGGTGGASDSTATPGNSSDGGMSATGAGATGVDGTGVDSTSEDDGIPGATTSACMGMPVGQGMIGEFCSEGCECASGICFSFPLVTSACSQCLNDADCVVNGVGTCSIDGDTESAVCTGGELGVMCQPASNSCAAGLQCAQLIDTAGVVPDTFCSECSVSADCAGGMVCAPTLVIEGAQPGGFLACIPPGSAPDGSFCPASGDASSCASGICAVVDIAGIGLADIGVCGPCAVNADCGGGVCQPPVVDGDGAVPSQCV